MADRSPRRAIAIFALVFATLASILAITFGLRLEPNVASLLPERGEAAALRRYVRAFGGGDLAVIMIKGEDPDENAAAATAIAATLATSSHVKRVAARAEIPRGFDPMLAFRYADAPARERLAKALTPEGMRARLRESCGSRKADAAPGASHQSAFSRKAERRCARQLFHQSAAAP